MSVLISSRRWLSSDRWLWRRLSSRRWLRQRRWFSSGLAFVLLDATLCHSAGTG
ncbi:hypothetical protein [Micromonospora zamorensis]|uniref:hypothetical protein n=1 Tax=Micromonospora zamorensis TaxID=709883 RepID=UPI00378D82AB